MKISKEILHTIPEFDKIVTTDNVFIGAKVMRGPDWSWFKQDGGKGNIGTIITGNPSVGWAVVEWPHRLSNHYRIGAEGKYDLIFAE